MIWKDYLKISFKKPVEDESIKSIRNKKKIFESSIEKCYSRLETIEICTSNSKNDDAILLSKALLIDIYNLLLEYHGEEKTLEIDSDSRINERIKDPSLLNIFISLKNNINLEDNEEENILKLESTLSETLYKLESEMKIHFENPIDNFKRRVIFQSIILLIIFGISGGSLFKKYLDGRPLKADYIGIQTSEDKNSTPTEDEISLTTQGEENWDTKKFTLPQPKNLEAIYISPIHQSKARFQFKDFKIYNDKAQILYEKSFILDSIDLTELLKTLKTEDIYPGKIVVGRALEMESIGNNPKMIINFEKKLEKVTQIEFKIRSTKRTNKYQD
jgi:hypothetical protein